MRLLTAERLLGLFLFLSALAAYLATLSWVPAPGQPARYLLLHLRLEDVPAALDPAWGWLVRRFALLPGLPVAAWTGLFSALCGAACVGLLGLLLCRVEYLLRDQPPATSDARARQARRLSALVAGLYLACSIPFWMVSTRSLPGSFHLLLLLLAAWGFSNYQISGRLRHLGVLGLLYGIGLSEFSTFWVFLPVALFLTGREMFHWGSCRSWKAYVVLGGGLLAGLALYPLQARQLFRHGVASGLVASPWQAWAQILQEQVQWITHAPYRNPVFVFTMVFAVGIWLVLFAMSHRSPWFYEGDQIAVRLVFAGILVFILLGIRFAWMKIGLANLMLTPLLLMAASMGFVTGELWILGEVQTLRDDSLPKRIFRRACSTGALLLPVVVLSGGVLNWRVVDGRHGRIVDSATRAVLDRLEGRDIVFSTGLLDDTLRLAVWERRWPVRVINVARRKSGPYLRHIARGFPEKALHGPLLQGNFNQFLDNLLLSGAGPARTAIIDLPELFREFGYLVPDGYIYRLETAADRVDLPALLDSQRPFWNRMEHLAAHPAPEANLLRSYQDHLLLLTSKMANNLAVMQAERGDEAGALETLRTARRICPDNLSVLLNLLELGRDRDPPEHAQWQEDWELRGDKLGGGRWDLANRYGYVWNALAWARRGWVWVLSGTPVCAEAARRNASASEADIEVQARLLELIDLQWGAPFRDENYYRAVLMQDGKNAGALLALGRLALRRNDPDTAEAYLDEAVALGLEEEDTQLMQAMTAYVRGDRGTALDKFKELAEKSPAAARAWMALLLLTDERDPINPVALNVLKTQPAPAIGLRLALAWVHLQRLQWPEAQAELDQAVQLDPRNLLAWELMATLAQIRGNQKLRTASLRALRNRNPSHSLIAVEKAIAHFQRGELTDAESGLRECLWRDRHPDVLNALANLIMEQAGDPHEARALVDEAVRKQPFHPMFRGTRAELNVREGRLDAAEEDLRLAWKALPDHVQILFLIARLHEARGNQRRACDLAQKLAARRQELSPRQRDGLDRWLNRCAGDD